MTVSSEKQRRSWDTAADRERADQPVTTVIALPITGRAVLARIEQVTVVTANPPSVNDVRGLAVAEARVPHTDGDHPCILVVDDDPSIRRLIVSMLRRDGYSLTEAQNGREALDAMRRGTEDLVLLDLMMPEMTGWEVLRIRDTTPELKRIPVIVITANYGAGVGEALSSGVCAVLPKPFDLAALQAIVKTCLPSSPMTHA